MNKKYQYRVYNEHMDFLITIPYLSDTWARGFAKGVAKDFYDYSDKHLENPQVFFVTDFTRESAINLKNLQEDTKSCND
jgi:hypothetical protein